MTHICIKKTATIETDRSTCESVTYDLDPADLLHEQGGHDVARQHGQAAQEADQVDEDVVLLRRVEVTASFVFVPGYVLQLTVDEFVLPQVWEEQEAGMVAGARF